MAHRDRPRAVGVVLSLLLLLGVLAGCSSGGGDGAADGGGAAPDQPATGDGTDDAGDDVALAAAPGSGVQIATAPPRAGISTPVQNVYYWIEDDNGDAPAEGAHMMMLFEPDGAAGLMVESAEDWLPIGGRWTFADDELTLTFAHEALTVDTSFAVDLEADEITMPFRLLSGGAEGTSRWIRSTSNPQSYLTTVFLVATGGGDDASGSEGVERAVAYSNAVITANGQAGADVSDLRAAPLQAPERGSRPGPITGVSVVEDPSGAVLDSEVEIHRSGAPPTRQLLWTWQAQDTDPLVLGQAPQASDPRTHLPTEPTGNGVGDPPNKRAVLFEPLATDDYFTWRKGFGARLQKAGGGDWKEVAEPLTRSGYDVQRIQSDDATIVGLTDAILAGGSAPGVLAIQSHGSSAGEIMTRDLVLDAADTTAYAAGDPGATARGIEAWKRTAAELDAAGYGDLWNYHNAAGTPALAEFTVHTAGYSDWNATYWGLTPAYWDWLRDAKGVDLSGSLVHLAACLVDQSDLRDHVRAGSFWAYNRQISPATSTAILRHLVESLAKPSWTAEEAFYNLVRVVNTEQVAYQHDKILDGIVPGSKEDGTTPRPLFDPTSKPLDKGFVLNAYGLDGTKAKPYAGNGWLDPDNVSGAQVWWMMWAARWGQNAIDGAANLEQCWNEFWSRGVSGGLASPFCNAANAGAPPLEPEVLYARWLLTGQSPPSGALTRWTLREAA